MSRLRCSRYDWWVFEAIDITTTILTTPFTTTLSLAGTCYCLTTFDTTSLPLLFLRFALAGPIFVIASLVLLLPAFIGWVIWAVLNTHASHRIQPFRYHQFHPNADQTHTQEGATTSWDAKRRATVCSANVLLCPEPVSRFNNCPHVGWRVREIGQRLLNQDSKLNLQDNLTPPVKREELVITQLPEVDILMLQEVVERWHAKRLIQILQHKYNHILHDIAVHTAANNLFMCGSGLFLASKYPVLDALFHPYSNYSHYGCLVALGVLMVKVDLGMVKGGEGKKMKYIGYVANTHTQAYQGEKDIVSKQVSEAADCFKAYIAHTHDAHTEKIAFAVLGGDFNSDNISKDQQVENTL